VLVFTNVLATLKESNDITAAIEGKGTKILLRHKMSPRQLEILIAGGLINWVKTHPIK
jgi:aconitate hydratase